MNLAWDAGIALGRADNRKAEDRSTLANGRVADGYDPKGWASLPGRDETVFSSNSLPESGQ